MKKLLSIIAMMVMVMALSLTAHATDPENSNDPATPTGSITITNATVGETYTVYRVFDATVNKDDQGKVEGYSYTIEEDNRFHAILFGENGEGTQYFDYDPASGFVKKKDGKLDKDVTNYLQRIVNEWKSDTVDADKRLQPAVAPIVATQPTDGSEPTVVFENLPYGYYVVTSLSAAKVTIDSNTPEAVIVDKNQQPGKVDKAIVVEGFGQDVDEADKVYGEFNSANISDGVEYKVTLPATNYDGDKKIQYYQIHDNKGEALWVEFNSIKVYIGEISEENELTKGYYLCEGDPTDLNSANEWDYLGTGWGNVGTGQEENVPNGEQGDGEQEVFIPEGAQWYLVHSGYDQFRIEIPWLEGHSITQGIDSEGNHFYNITYANENAAPLYDSPTKIILKYTAAIEANATIGGAEGESGNLYNKASASWVSKNYTGESNEDIVYTKVYGIGLLKADTHSGEVLEGAEFRLYKDAACEQPVFLVPSKIDGVYKVDSLYTYGGNISGVNTESTRAESMELDNGEKLRDYLDRAVQNNLVVSQVNGKLVILGLKEGTYYLKEVTPPPGYNVLFDAIPIVVDGKGEFKIFADADGNVAHLQQTDGTYLLNTFQVVSTVVHNSTGQELPSTGGFGRTAIIACGSLVAIGFAILLITHKKMSIYTD